MSNPTITINVAKSAPAYGALGALVVALQVAQRLKYEFYDRPRLEDQIEESVKRKEIAQARLAMVEQRLNGLMIPPSVAERSAKKVELGVQDGYYHVAICGDTGTGKSSFINAMCRLRDGDPGAAETDFIECTSTVTPYKMSDMAVVLYDTPGAGTCRVPDWDYFRNQGLYLMDVVVLICGDRILDPDIAILRNCVRLKIPCIIVRTKSDLFLRNASVNLECKGDWDDETESPEVNNNARVLDALERLRKYVDNEVGTAFERSNLPRPTAPVEDYFFVVNRASLYKLRTTGVLDNNALDEQRLLQLLHERLANETAAKDEE